MTPQCTSGSNSLVTLVLLLLFLDFLYLLLLLLLELEDDTELDAIVSVLVAVLEDDLGECTVFDADFEGDFGEWTEFDFEACGEPEDKRVSDFVDVVVTVCVEEIEETVEIFGNFDETFVNDNFDSGIVAKDTTVSGEGGFWKKYNTSKLLIRTLFCKKQPNAKVQKKHINKKNILRVLISNVIFSNFKN